MSNPHALAEAIIAACEGYSGTQRHDALELITARKIHPVPDLPGVHVAISSDGTTRYICDPHGCQCAAGRRKRPCKHRLAVLFLIAYDECEAAA